MANIGLICRYLNDDNMYMFEITQDGYYAIYKLLQGRLEFRLIDYTYSSFVESLDQCGYLKPSCVGDTLRFAVNGKLLGEVQDSAISPPGITASLPAHSTTAAILSHLMIWWSVNHKKRAEQKNYFG